VQAVARVGLDRLNFSASGSKWNRRPRSQVWRA